MKAIETEVVVLGAGPGGYAAAFYAADKGKKVILVEEEPRLGGVCLNRGCIPSKTFLHASKLIKDAREAAPHGITFEKPKIDLNKMREWKESVLNKLGQGIVGLAKRRGVEIYEGRGIFDDSNTLRVETKDGQKFIRFQKAIIAVGSKPALPKAFDLGNKRIMTSTEALDLEDIPERLLIVGGGYIGMELGTVYHSLGSRVVVCEALDALLSGADNDLLKYVQQNAQKNFDDIRLGVKVKSMATKGKKIEVNLEMNGEIKTESYDRVLVSIGRAPNCEDIGLENTKVKKDAKGFIQVSKQQVTDDPNILAIGDIVGGAMLAHKASKEARIAVDAILGEESPTHEVIIPAVVFTDPELAWCGLTETEAKAKNIPIAVSRFSWQASGRALTFDRTDGLTKLIIEKDTGRILGVGIVGAGASELISEGVLAVEMGATAKDLAESVHPHPTLSETLMESAESFYGTATHAFSRKAR